jgi:hypothetical protein
MLKIPLIVGSAIASLAAISMTYAETITEKSGDSVSTITQEPGMNMKRKVIKTPDGQTIIQESNGNSAVVIQNKTGSLSKEEREVLSSECEKRLAEIEKEFDGDEPEKEFSKEDEECFGGSATFAKKMRQRRETLNSSDEANPSRFGPGFERLQKWRDKMKTMRSKENEGID